jgi:hypothetical protein
MAVVLRLFQPSKNNATPGRYGLPVAGLLLGLLSLSACGQDADDSQPPTPDVSGIQVKVDIRRFEQDLFAVDTTRFRESLQVLAAKYPDFLPVFFREVVGGFARPNESPEDALAGFVKAEPVRRLNDSCQLQYADLRWLEPELAQIFKYYRYYFPNRHEPRVVTAVTEFVGDAYMPNDSVLMLGLDFFLGENFVGYNPEAFPAYLRKQFVRPAIPLKTALAMANFVVPPPSGDHVIDHMVRNGKVLYLLDCLTPGIPDSVKMNYTADQWAGCVSNEQNLWARLLDMKVLYQPLNSKNIKIVTPGPATDNVFQEAPGEVGNWMGWQIVRAWAKRHPNATMAEILAPADAQQYLEQAKYKPKRKD